MPVASATLAGKSLYWSYAETLGRAKNRAIAALRKPCPEDLAYLTAVYLPMDADTFEKFFQGLPAKTKQDFREAVFQPVGKSSRAEKKF